VKLVSISGDADGRGEQRTRLQQKLRSRRYALAASSCFEVLESAGISAGAVRVVEVDDAEALYERFGSRLRLEMHHSVSWPASQHADARERLCDVADAVSGRSMVWLALVDARPIGIWVPAANMLRAALDVFVSYSADLYLTSSDARAGICVDVDFQPEIERYQLVTWSDDSGL
jgi:hypothetical protein